ncbi:MAG: hypothetical protein KKC25_09210 [Proteobacteria bacterium]|nr:hypothetical protein [Pseudomonadota bacterium]MBU2261168.1 hypothetical protein [Pseudomonadota bacterium]
MNDPDILKINVGIASKFQRVEDRLAVCRTAGELFEVLLEEIIREFSIPFVWLSFIRRPETAGLLADLAKSEFLRDRLNILAEDAFLAVIPDGSPPLLANGDLRAFFRLLPASRKYLLRSLAVSPLTLNGRPIGSLNHGDASPDRYQPGMDTTLLGRLADRISKRIAVLMPPETAPRPFPIPDRRPPFSP